MNIALVHEFLITWGGSDLVVQKFGEIWPQAPIYTALYDPKEMDARFPGRTIHKSFLQRFGFLRNRHRLAMPFFPIAFEQFDLTGYDVVLSSHHMAAKGVLSPATACHICFVHTPMRFGWDLYPQYMAENPGLKGLPLRLLFHYLRIWDVASAARVDYYIANSRNVAARIWKHYRRESTVIHSPVEASRFAPAKDVGDYYLMLGRLVPYKRADVAVEAFRNLNERLVIAGSGPQLAELKKRAPKNVEFLGFVPDEQIPSLYAGCRAFLFPGVEDFGITPLEAQASGRPVIALRAGGALETVVEGRTGCFFDESTPQLLADAVRRFDWAGVDPIAVREHAMAFDVERYKKRIHAFVEEHYAEWKERMRTL
jgi:glycosyltransferase involved in cell wall biosynthesis